MAVSRRCFFKAAIGAPLIPASLPGQPAVRRHDSEFDPWIEVYPVNLRNNVAEVSRRVAGRPILAVIKNNGYGLGLANVARILDALPQVAGLAVVKADEAHTLRDAGIKKPVMFMGPFSEKELEEAVARDIRPMIYTPVGPALDRIAGRLQRWIPIHICIDTGIGRIGVPYRQASSLARDLAGRKAVRIEGIMMTFTEDSQFDAEQLKRFQTLCLELAAAGVQVGKKHAASSFALFQHPDSFMDMVRPGMALFGIYPDKEFRNSGVMNLRPALALKTRVIYVKRLSRGESAGYERAYVAADDIWVATLPVGHADGYPRSAAKGGRVKIGGAFYPVIASVSASHTIIEIGPEPRVREGEVATLFDGEAGSRPEDLSAATGVSVYDLTMHLGALLPRKVI
jgi:alanine racemase